MTARGTLIPSLLFACLIVIAGQAAPEDAGHPVSMWQIEGNSNRIYLLGSVHVLREQDHPIPTAIEEAYKDAEILIMEVDMDDIDQIEMVGLVIELGVIGDSGSLQEYMGQELYAEAEHYASQLKIPIAMLGQTEPWLAAITVEQMMLLRLGFKPQYGIELHLMAKAVKDEKEVLGFETAREQLEFLDGLSLPMQRLLLLQTLKDNLNIEEDLNLLISAWRHGDIGFLEETLLAEIDERLIEDREHPGPPAHLEELPTHVDGHPGLGTNYNDRRLDLFSSALDGAEFLHEGNSRQELVTLLPATRIEVVPEQAGWIEK